MISPPRALLLVLLFSISALGNPQPVFVDGSAEGTGDGTSWDNAFVSLSAALDGSPKGSEIWVAAGVYRPDATGLLDPSDASFVLKQNMALIGGFAGWESSIDERDPDARLTILSGDILQNDSGDRFGPSWDDNAYYLVRIPFVDAGVTLDSIHVTRTVFGISSGGGVSFRNGSIFENHIGLSSHSLDETTRIEVESVRFVDNDISLYSQTNTWARVSDCTFIDSDVDIQTRAAGEASVVFDGCVFENSHLEFEPHCARPTILNSRFIRSGIEVEYGDGELVIEGCEFQDVVGSPITAHTGVHVRDSQFVTSPENAGQTQRLALYGGRSRFERVLFDGVAQVEAGGDEVVFRGCTFRNIQGRYAIEGFEASMTIEDCEFHGNGSESAISASQATTISRTRIEDYAGTCVAAGFLSWIEDSIISNCGGSAIEGGRPQVINCTVANTGGSAITSDTAQVRNSIFLNAPLDVYYSSNNILWPEPEEPSDMRWTNRFLDPLLLDPAGGDFRLQAGSPAIDAGNSLFRGTGNETDAVGEPRIVDDPGTPNCPHRQSLCGHGEPIDAGAHEFQGDSGSKGFGRGIDPPAIVFVKAGATGANDGTSWEDAYATLSAALAANRRSVDIWIAAGEYTPDPTEAVNPRSATLELSCEDEPEGCRIRLHGSFAGTESSIDERDLSTLTTALSGDIGVRGDDADNSLNVLSLTWGDRLVARLDGLVVRDGNGTKGSGAIVWFAQAHIDRCRFENNRAPDGALAIIGARATHVTNSEFASNEGRGMFVAGPAEISSCGFRQNAGYALTCSNGRELVRVSDSSFVENVSYSVLWLANIPAIVERCRFEDNTGTGGSSRPISADRALVRNVVFARNEVATHRLHSNANGDWRYSFPALSSIYLTSPPGEEDQLLCDRSDNTCAYPGSNPDRMVDPGGGDYRLLPNSRAIDIARPGSSTAYGPGGVLWPGTSADYDGAPRAVEHGAPRGGIPCSAEPFGGVIDRGAFEFQGVSVFGDDDGNGRADLDDFASLIPCLDGPAMDADDPERINGTCLDVFGGEGSRSGRIDLRSFAAFQRAFGETSQ